MEPIQAQHRVPAGTCIRRIKTLEELGVRTSDHRIEMPTVEAGERHLRLPRKAGHGRDRSEVVAGVSGEPIDHLDQLLGRAAVDHAGGLRDQSSMFRQDIFAPLFEEEVNAEMCKRWDHHHGSARPGQQVRNQAPQQETDGLERCSRQHVHRVEVPAVDDEVGRLTPGHADPAALELVEALLEAVHQPALEERRHRIAQPFAEAEVPDVAARYRRQPAGWLRQRGDRARLEQMQLAVGDRPLDVLGTAEPCLRLPRQICNRHRLGGVDGALCASHLSG